MFISAWAIVVVEAIAATGMLFGAHEMPVNKNYLEPRMAAGKPLAYVLGFAFYAAALMIPIGLVHGLALLFSRSAI